METTTLFLVQGSGLTIWGRHVSLQGRGAIIIGRGLENPIIAMNIPMTRTFPKVVLGLVRPVEFFGPME